MKKKWLIYVCIVGICMTVSGCNNSQEQTISDSQGITEAQVQTDNSVSNASDNKTDGETSSNSSTSSGGKVQVTEDIKSKILELAPGLSDYKSGQTISDEAKFKFVYYGYVYGDLSRYTKRQLTKDGVTNTWALVPKSDVESKFKETFGIDLGDYSPKYNKDDPSVYLENGCYYICTTASIMEINYSFISNKDNSIQIKASYKGDDSHYDEYNITIQPANNTLGFTIRGVSIIPK